MTEINTDVFIFLNNKNEAQQLSSPENEIKDSNDSEITEQDLPF